MEIDKEYIKNLVEDTKIVFPNVDDYLLWNCAIDYYVKDVLKINVEETEEIKELIKKANEEGKNRIYENVEIK